MAGKEGGGVENNESQWQGKSDDVAATLREAAVTERDVGADAALFSSPGPTQSTAPLLAACSRRNAGLSGP